MLFWHKKVELNYEVHLLANLIAPKMSLLTHKVLLDQMAYYVSFDKNSPNWTKNVHFDANMSNFTENVSFATKRKLHQIATRTFQIQQHLFLWLQKCQIGSYMFNSTQICGLGPKSTIFQVTFDMEFFSRVPGVTNKNKPGGQR